MHDNNDIVNTLVTVLLDTVMQQLGEAGAVFLLLVH